MTWLSEVPMCGLYGKPVLAAMHLFGSAGVWLAYMLIPIAIGIVMVKRGFRFNSLAIMFALFIASCGIGHLTYITASLWGWYWLEGTVIVITAIISLFTAIYIFVKIPVILTIPTPENHRRLVENIKRVVPDGWVDFYQDTEPK